jgi:predicted amidophosphoribosyltransferase
MGVNEHGYDVYKNDYTELGELLYRLKYRGDQSAAPEIILTACEFLKPYLNKFDCVIPVPPSIERPVQPVVVLANGIGLALGLPVLHCVTTTRRASEQKNIGEPARRRESLEGLYDVDPRLTEGRKVLLFDDLFRSGATLNSITDLLHGKGKAASVRVVTITRTRSKR